MGIAVHDEVLGPVEQDTDERGLIIKVLAVGGAGCKTLSRMHSAGAPGVQYYCLNTDRRSLERSEGPKNILLGEGLTGGLGTGGKPEVGRRAAESSRDEILHAVELSDLVLIVAGMGGGTGSGAAPVVAALAREAGAHVTAVVTKPFGFEATWRQENSEQGISELKRHSHSLLVVHHADLAASAGRLAGIVGVGDRPQVDGVAVAGQRHEATRTVARVALDHLEAQELVEGHGPLDVSHREVDVPYPL